MLILASTSPWRLKMVRDAGLPIEGVAPTIEEYTIQADSPEVQSAPADPGLPAPSGAGSVALALGRAYAKARSVAEIRPEAWVIGADQVCWMDGLLFEKPRSPAEHLEHLRILREKSHFLSTAVCVIHPQGMHRFVEHSEVCFRKDLNDQELRSYVASGEGAGCAGGYQVEARGALLIGSIRGDWYNVIGLPLFRLITVLRQQGWKSPLASENST